MNAPADRQPKEPRSEDGAGEQQAHVENTGVLAKLKSFARTYGSIEDSVVAIALGISALAGFFGIVLRYVVHTTIWELFPIQHYTFLFAVLIGAAMASRKKLHVRVEVLDTVLKKNPRRMIGLRTAMLLIAFISCCLFTYLSIGFSQWAWDIKQTDTVLTWFHLGTVKTLPLIMGFISSIAFGTYFVKSLNAFRATPVQSGGDQ